MRRRLVGGSEMWKMEKLASAEGSELISSGTVRFGRGLEGLCRISVAWRFV